MVPVLVGVIVSVGVSVLVGVLVAVSLAVPSVVGEPDTDPAADGDALGAFEVDAVTADDGVGAGDRVGDEGGVAALETVAAAVRVDVPVAAAAADALPLRDDEPLGARERDREPLCVRDREPLRVRDRDALPVGDTAVVAVLELDAEPARDGGTERDAEREREAVTERDKTPARDGETESDAERDVRETLADALRERDGVGDPQAPTNEIFRICPPLVMLTSGPTTARPASIKNRRCPMIRSRQQVEFQRLYMVMRLIINDSPRSTSQNSREDVPALLKNVSPPSCDVIPSTALDAG